MFVFFLVISCFCQAEGAFRNLIFERTPSTESLTGLGCALEEYDESHARGVKFDSESGTCEALPESWFTSPTFEDKKYHKLLMEEMIFQAGPTIISEMPPDFTTSGSSVVLNVYLGTIANDEFAINVEGQYSGIICYHLNVRLFSNEIVFNSLIGGWGSHIGLTNNGRFSTSYTTYRIELKFTAVAIKMEVWCTPLIIGRLSQTAIRSLTETDTTVQPMNAERSSTFIEEYEPLRAVNPFLHTANMQQTTSNIFNLIWELYKLKEIH